MKYTVLWSRAAQNELARLWNAASDRAALSAGADLMDAALALNPFECGESREHDEFRIMFAHPLAIEFQIKPDDRIVIVVGVWRTR
jgi:hypothetical protein